MNANKRKVLNLMLSPQASTIPQIADSAGLGERTVYSYLADPEFKRELDARLDQAIAEATINLTRISGKAVRTLEAIMDNQEASDTNRRLAAVSILDATLRMQELKATTDRISRLEAAVFNK